VQFSTRSVTVGTLACTVLVLAGTVLFMYGAMHHGGVYHGLRYMIGGATLGASGLVWGGVIALAWRSHVLTDVYRQGYLQGRKDANQALLEAGLLLSLDEMAEQMYQDEDNGNGD